MGKIVIYGMDLIGAKLAETLYNEGQDIIVIDSNKKNIDSIQRNLDVMAVNGKIGDDYTIKQAMISSSELFIAVTDSDEENIVACHIAKKQNVPKTIARLRNPAFLNKNILNTTEIGIDNVINPEREVAKEIFKLIIAPWANDVHSVLKSKVYIFEIKPTEENIRYFIEKLNDISETNQVFIYDNDAKNGIYQFKKGNPISLNSQIFIIEEAKNTDKLNSMFKDQYPHIKNIMILGGGKTTYELLTLLEDVSINVKVVEASKRRCTNLNENFKNAMILCGQETDTELFMLENVVNLDCLISLTDNDENNIVMSLFAKQKGVQKSIAKITKPYGKDILSGMGLNIADTYKVTLNKILSIASKKNVTAYSRLNEDIDIMEFSIPRGLKVTRQLFKKKELSYGAIISTILNDDNIIFPNENFKITENSRVLILSNKKYSHLVEKQFRKL